MSLNHHSYSTALNSVWTVAHTFLLQRASKANKLIKTNFDNKLLLKTVLNLRKTFIIYELL